MAWTTFQLILALTMVVTGSINTLSTKWADLMYAVGSDGELARLFNHPFVQAVGMFIGEFSCLVVFHIMRLFYKSTSQPMDIGPQTFNPLILLPAGLLDMCGTSIMYIALNLTYASSFQMLRGAIMIFTALFSVIFLRQVIKNHMWLGMLAVVLGLLTVGISDMMFTDNKTSDTNGIISGDMLLIIAQVISAGQMVYEEKFVTKHNIPPLQAVGWEGFFGMTVLGILLIPMYYIKIGPPFSTDPDGRMENVFDAFTQMGNNKLIILAQLGTIVSIAFFNFSGISVTKELSATTRMVLDSCRTLIIWAFSLAVMWQPFHLAEFFIQGFGFVLLIVGLCLYNNLLFSPLLSKVACLNPNIEEDLLPVIRDASADEKNPLLSETPEIQPYMSDNPPPYSNSVNT